MSEFIALNTKIRAMSRDLLSNESFQALLEARDNREQIQFLKAHVPYGETLREDAFVSEVELRLARGVYEDLSRLGHYLYGANRDFYDHLMSLFFLEDLKHSLRALVRREDPEGVEAHRVTRKLPPIDSHTGLREFVEALPENYRRRLLPLLAEDDNRILFVMEMNLDRDYYRRLMTLAEKLSGANRDYVKAFYGREIDLLNLEWIYRAGKFYHLPPEIIFNYTILHGQSLGMGKLKTLSYLSTEDLMDEVKKGPYAFLFDSEHDIDLYMSRRIDRSLYYPARRFLRSTGDDIRPLLGIVTLLEFEIYDIAKAMETKRFELLPRLAKSYLIRQLDTKTERM